ncbi:hypothetical protein DFJ73DRAFT_841771 [Zopfochytrium polystomum]|nr:hypothetical protein DFJ73DRAFT_841771 [Zopfochytrium polystomum]
MPATSTEISLSHTWGHGGAIAMMGKEPTRLQHYDEASEPIHVAERFYAKLARTKSHFPTHKCWMDAFDVNQANPVIKGHQVGKMYEHYEDHHVCIVPEKECGSIIESFNEIVKEGYLERAWVRQEIVLSRSLSIACNPTLISDFSVAWCLYLAEADNPVDLNQRFLAFTDFSKIRLLRQTPFTLAEITSRAKAFFPIDILVAGANAAKKRIPPVDYTKDVYDLWSEFELYGFGHDIARAYVDMALVPRARGESLLRAGCPVLAASFFGPLCPYMAFVSYKTIEAPTTAPTSPPEVPPVVKCPILQLQTTRAGPACFRRVPQDDPSIAPFASFLNLLVVNSLLPSLDEEALIDKATRSLRFVLVSEACLGAGGGASAVCLFDGETEKPEERTSVKLARLIVRSDMVIFAVLEQENVSDEGVWRCVGFGATNSFDGFSLVEELALP